jgi:hypothetical protein
MTFVESATGSTASRPSRKACCEASRSRHSGQCLRWSEPSFRSGCGSVIVASHDFALSGLSPVQNAKPQQGRNTLSLSFVNSLTCFSDWAGRVCLMPLVFIECGAPCGGSGLLFVLGPRASPWLRNLPPRRGGAERETFFRQEGRRGAMERGAAFCEDVGNTAGREGPKRRSHGYWASLFCRAPAGGDTPVATGVSPWERVSRNLN